MARQSSAPSERVRVKRLHERGKYDLQTVHAILDSMPLCHVGYVFDGQPYVTPTLQWREGDRVFWHGSSASRMLRTVDEADVCLTVSILDGFVMARSAFHHSANYRSAMILGKARKVTDQQEAEASLRSFVDGLFPGRWDMLRPMSAQEFKATSVLSMDLTEASAKVRTGMPVDDEEDYALPIWAGVIPIRMEVLPPQSDPRNLDGVEPPEHVQQFQIAQ